MRFFLVSETRQIDLKPVSYTNRIHADQQNQNNINYDERIPNKQAEKPTHTSYK